MAVRPDHVDAHQQRQKHADKHRRQRQEVILNPDDFMVEAEDVFANEAVGAAEREPSVREHRVATWAAIIVSPPPEPTPFVEVFLADHFQHAMHFVVAETAKLGAGDFIVPDFCGSEVHVDFKPGNRVLLEAHVREQRSCESRPRRASVRSTWRFTGRYMVPVTTSSLAAGSLSVQTNCRFVAGGRIHQLGTGGAKLAVRPGIAEIPGKLHAGHFHRNRSRFRRGKTFRRPDVASHQVQADNKDDGSEHGPQHFQLGIAVGVLDLLGVRAGRDTSTRIAQGTCAATKTMPITT